MAMVFDKSTRNKMMRSDVCVELCCGLGVASVVSQRRMIPFRLKPEHQACAGLRGGEIPCTCMLEYVSFPSLLPSFASSFFFPCCDPSGSVLLPATIPEH